MEQNLVLSINKIMKKILITDLFYGLFMSTIDRQERKDIPLAAVGVNKSTMNFTLFINPDEWFKFSDEVKYGVLLHECKHLTLFHLITVDKYPNHLQDNYATDIEINQTINKQYLPSWGIFIEEMEKKYPKLDWKQHAGRDHYYKELSKLSDKEKQELGIDERAKHIWIILDGDGNKVDGLTESEIDAIRVQVEGTIEGIVEEINKSQGHIPVEINQLIKGFKKPKPVFNYQKYIRNFVGNSTKYSIGTSRIRENLRFPGQPKVVLKPLSKVAIYLDESGSVSETTLGIFLNEVYHLKRKHDIHIFPFDTEILREVKFQKGDTIVRTNCGGTNPECCLEHYKKNGFHSAIIYTDGFFSQVSKFPKEVLWVIDPNGDMKSTENQEKVIKIPKE